MKRTGTVITVYRGGCEVVYGDAIRTLRMTGRQAEEELQLAVGDEIAFDDESDLLLELLPRRTVLRRLRPQAGRRTRDPSAEQIIATNVDQLAVVMSTRDPPFRSGAVDRFRLAALAGGLESLLVVNKIDLLPRSDLPEEIDAYLGVLPVVLTSARRGDGMAELGERLAGARTVLAGHSGVGKSSLINALAPELELLTDEVREKSRKGRHTTTHSRWLRLPGDAIVVDTPGVREIATGPVDPALLDQVYPEIAERGADCRFRDCAHAAEPDCAVRSAVEAGTLHPGRLRNFQRLRDELRSA